MTDTKYMLASAKEHEEKLKGCIKSELEDLSALVNEDRPMDWLMNVTFRIQKNIAELHRIRGEQKIALIAIEESENAERKVKMQTYKIIRFYKDIAKSGQVVATGLTLEEAQDHCNDPDTRGEDWFDGYEKE